MSDPDPTLERRLRAGSRRTPPAVPDARADALAAAAAAADLLDVAYTVEDSPLGALLIAATPHGLVRLAYLDTHPLDAVLGALATRVSPRVLEAPVRLDPVRRELAEYFAGERAHFGLSLDRRLIGAGFAGRVLTCTATIGYGETVSYAEVAERAGSPRGFRAAGNALGANPLPIVIPCHRVLASGGGLGGYTGGAARKRTLLDLEGRPALTSQV